MTTKEMLDYLKNNFERDCYELFCELRDCIECPRFLDEIAQCEKDGDGNGKSAKNIQPA